MMYQYVTLAEVEERVHPAVCLTPFLLVLAELWGGFNGAYMIFKVIILQSTKSRNAKLHVHIVFHCNISA